MSIGYKPWRGGTLSNTSNINYGFQPYVLWPVNFTAIHIHLNIFKYIRILATAPNSTWVNYHKTSQTEVV